MSVNYLYSPTFGNNAQPIMQYGPQAYAAARVSGEIAEATTGESSLASEVGGTALFMGGITAAPKIVHPKNTIGAYKYAQDAMKTAINAGVTKEAAGANWSKAFNAHFKGNKFGLDSAKELSKLNKEYAKTLASYKKALKSGNLAEIAKYEAQLETMQNLSKKPIFFQRWFGIKNTKTAEEVVKAGKEAGKAAAKTAQTATTTATTGTKTVKETLAAAKNSLKSIKDVKTAVQVGKSAAGATAIKAWNGTKNALRTGGAGTMAVIEGAIEGFTEVLPAFTEGGMKEGIKQTAKSTVTVGGSVVGWCVGAKAGGSLGATIGTLICPGIGTAIGGFIGSIVGGAAASWAGRKAAKAITGKSYSEKKAEQEQTQQAQAQQVQQQSLIPQPLNTQPQTQQQVNPFTYNYSNPMNNINTPLGYNMINPINNPFSNQYQSSLFNSPLYQY